ncbi:hypothetical protein [Streptomyces brevispora]|uniref:Uncharacterized protein n=1 Tax=Streptomyces brevispora TaxID=887462 RepID=A0ABZ1GDS7_9ACTN|nr:hypothetical protein [Streptomyces brevispora]WSC18146.1 hypothetical protein OIE64_24030 [Streptomyces brevispora]
MLQTCVVVEPPPPVAVLPPELELPPLLPPDEDDPPLPDVPLVETRGGCAHDSSASTILNASLAEVLWAPADGLCEQTFQLEVCTTERRSSLASTYEETKSDQVPRRTAV